MTYKNTIISNMERQARNFAEKEGMRVNITIGNEALNVMFSFVGDERFTLTPIKASVKDPKEDTFEIVISEGRCAHPCSIHEARKYHFFAPIDVLDEEWDKMWGDVWADVLHIVQHIKEKMLEQLNVAKAIKEAKYRDNQLKNSLSNTKGYYDSLIQGDTTYALSVDFDCF